MDYENSLTNYFEDFQKWITVAPESAFITCCPKLCLKSFLTVILESLTFKSQAYIHFQIEEGFYIALSESVQFVRNCTYSESEFQTKYIEGEITPNLQSGMMNNE